MRSGNITRTLSGPQNWALVLRNRCFLGLCKRGDKISSGYIIFAIQGAQS